MYCRCEHCDKLVHAYGLEMNLLLFGVFWCPSCLDDYEPAFPVYRHNLAVYRAE